MTAVDDTPVEKAVGAKARWDQCAVTANLALAVWLAADIVRIMVFSGEFHIKWLEGAEIGILAIAILLVMQRPRPRHQDASFTTIAIAIGATLLPVLYGVLGVNVRPSSLVITAQAFALALMGAALVCRGTNFSVLPHYRSLVATGPYRLIRHPIYASYLLFDGALVVGARSEIGAILWIVELALLSVRARIEEQLLAESNPEYLCYSAATHCRLIPFLV